MLSSYQMSEIPYKFFLSKLMHVFVGRKTCFVNVNFGYWELGIPRNDQQRI